MLKGQRCFGFRITGYGIAVEGECVLQGDVADEGPKHPENGGGFGSVVDLVASFGEALTLVICSARVLDLGLGEGESADLGVEEGEGGFTALILFDPKDGEELGDSFTEPWERGTEPCVTEGVGESGCNGAGVVDPHGDNEEGSVFKRLAFVVENGKWFERVRA